MNIEFVKAKPSDYEEIHQVMQLSAREISGKAYHDEVKEIFDKFYNDRTPAYIKQTLANPNNQTLLAKSGSRIVGFIQLGVQNIAGTISHLYILPGFEGNSIGTQLFNHMREKATRMGVQILFVESTLNAVSYYEKIGFVNKKLITDCSAYTLDMELNRV